MRSSVVSPILTLVRSSAYDAAQDPEASGAILTALLGGRRLRSPDSEVRFNITSASGLSSDLEPRLFTGQQSNTSVMLGDTAIIKLFRRLELGHNLDIEVHGALNAADISDVAGLFGWVEGNWVSGGRQLDADLAMVIEQLTGAVDGWELALDSLKAENASPEVRVGSGFAPEAEALGKALSDIHHALRSAFPTKKVLGARTAMIMMDRLREAAGIAPALTQHIPGLLRCFDHLSAETLDTQRVHGDFHLGQTLRTPDWLEDHRLRGRACQDHGRKTCPRQRLARHRRDAALVRLCGGERTRTTQRSLGGRVPGRLPARLRRRGAGCCGCRHAARVRGGQGDLRGRL